MKRSHSDLEANVTMTKAALETARKEHDAAVRAFAQHPTEIQKYKNKQSETLRKTLPAYLYQTLVVDAQNPISVFYIGNTCDWAGDDPCNIFEISIYYVEGKSRCYAIPFWEDTLEAENIDNEFALFPFDANVKTAWAKALKANGNVEHQALAALIYVAAMHFGDTTPRTDFLARVYSDDASDSSDDSSES